MLYLSLQFYLYIIAFVFLIFPYNLIWVQVTIINMLDFQLFFLNKLKWNFNRTSTIHPAQGVQKRTIGK